MMRNQKWDRLRFGLLTLPIGGIIGIVALLLRGPISPLPDTDPTAWVEVVTSSLYSPAQFGYIIAYVLPYFGFWALYAWLAQIERVERLAFWGFMGAMIGTSLALPTLGVFSFVNPSIGKLYAQGDHHLLQIISNVVTGPPVVINLSGGTIYLAGTILLGVAVWRCGALPKWSGVCLAVHGVLLVFGFSIFVMLVLSWALLVIGGGWISWSIWKQRAP
jgi:hypothetical protein